MKYGNVKWYNSKKGYGFIEPDGENKDVFVHISQLEKANIKNLVEGQRIGFDIYDDRGRVAAGDLVLLQFLKKTDIGIFAYIRFLYEKLLF